MSKLSAKARKALPKTAFALPGGRYPIHDKRHAANALARVAQHGSPDEQAKVKAAVARRYPALPSSKKRKPQRSAERTYAIDDPGDIELGSYGSKWKHGWIPLNPVATALKLKQLRAGGSHQNITHAGHSILIARTHRGTHGALVVHKESGAAHYIEHDSPGGAGRMARSYATRQSSKALSPAQREAAVRSYAKREGVPVARVRGEGHGDAELEKYVPSTKAPEGYKVSTPRNSFTTRVHTKDNEYVGSVEKRAEGHYVAHHESTSGGNAAETSYKFHGQAVRGLVNQHQANREAAVSTSTDHQLLGDLSRARDAGDAVKVRAVTAELKRRGWTHNAGQGWFSPKAKYGELRRVGLDHEQATAGVAKIEAAKPGTTPRPDAAETFRKQMSYGGAGLSTSRAEATRRNEEKRAAARKVREDRRATRGSMGERISNPAGPASVTTAGLPNNRYQIVSDNFGLTLKHNGKIIRTSSDRESLTKFATEHHAGMTKPKTTSEGVDKVTTTVSGGFTDTASNGKQYDHNAQTGIVYRRDGALVGTMHKNADGTWKIEGVNGSLPVHNVKTRSQAINGLAVAHDLYLKRSDEDKAKKAADAEAATSTAKTMRDESFERSQLIAKITGDRKRQRLIESELLVGGGTHEEQMARLRVKYAAKRAADIKAAQGARAREDAARKRHFAPEPKRRPVLKDTEALAKARAELQRRTERTALDLNGGHAEAVAAIVHEGVPVTHGGRAGHVIGVYGQTFDTYHPPTEGQNGFYMRHEIRTRRGRKEIVSTFAGHSQGKAS